MSPKLKIYESTWIGLLQSKIASVKNIPELLNWSTGLQQVTPNLPTSIKLLLSDYASLIRDKDQIFLNVETDEAKFLLIKNYLLEKTITFLPFDDSKALRQEYIAKFAEVIPDFAAVWDDDVNCRMGDDSLIMLFVFLSGILHDYDEKTLFEIFKIIDVGLIDTREIVQAEIVKGLLLDIALEKTNYTKNVKYMPATTCLFCRNINSIWHGAATNV